MTQTYFAISDLHIDAVTTEDLTIFLHALNTELRAVQNPVLLIAGDVSNSVQKTFNFLEKLECKCVFVKGNHEHRDERFEYCPPNVVMLNNSFIEYSDAIIYGSTLWTDLGTNSCDTLATMAFKQMKDFSKIKDATLHNITAQNHKSCNFLNNSIPSAINASGSKTVYVLTHHAPFIEEVIYWKLINGQKPDLSLLQKDRVELFSKSYLNDCSNGRIDDDTNIFYVRNYFNTQLQAHAPITWVHGHTHELSGLFYCLGSTIACNPKPVYFEQGAVTSPLLLNVSPRTCYVDPNPLIHKALDIVLNAKEVELLLLKLSAIEPIVYSDIDSLNDLSPIVFYNYIDSLKLSLKELSSSLTDALVWLSLLLSDEKRVIDFLFKENISFKIKELSELSSILSIFRTFDYCLEFFKQSKSTNFYVEGKYFIHHFEQLKESARSLTVNYLNK